MKTFKDLVFENHPVAGGKMARMQFDNGYGISVISGKMFYTSDSAPYECAVLFNDDITYNTSITDDVIGHQTEEGITEVMAKIQSL